MEIKILNMENQKAWEDLVKKTPESKIQHSLEWKNAMEKAYKNQEASYYLGTEKGEIRFLIPFFFVRSKLLGNRLISVPFLDNGGFLGKIDKKDMEKIKERISEDFRNKKIKGIEIKMNSSAEEFDRIKKILKKLGFDEDDSKQQFIISLATEEDMWKRFHKHTRNDIRMAEKSGLEIEKIGGKDELKKFYRLYFQNMKYFGTPQHSYGFFKNLLKKLGEKFVGFNCYYKDLLAASIIMFYHGKNAYIAFNVSHPKYRRYRPNDLLYWEMIKWSVKKGLKQIDLGQIDRNFEKNSREQNLYKFKSKWLGEVYDKSYFYYNFENIKKGERRKKEKLKKYRRIWKRLPSPFLKIIGPKICSQLGL